MGPLPDPNCNSIKIKENFPAYYRTQPIVSAKKRLDKSANKAADTSVEVTTQVETTPTDTVVTIDVEVENPIN